MKERLDVLLVARGLAETRERAQALILAGKVIVGEQRVDKPGARVPADVDLRLKGHAQRFVSRGGEKLAAALEHFGLEVRGLVCADIGASTGGFTDCLLKAGASRVYALDVGYGQLHESLRVDARVVNVERVNARYLTEEQLPERVEVMVVDVSFISLRLVLPSALARLRTGGTLVALVKPQFEVGPESVGKGGVVRDLAARAAAIQRVTEFARECGLSVLGVIDCPIAGPRGNVEALLAARKEREL